MLGAASQLQDRNWFKEERKVSKTSIDGLNTLQRQRLFTLEQQRYLDDRSTRACLEEDEPLLSEGPCPTTSSLDAPPSPPLSPGEACWDNKEDVLTSTALNSSYATSSTSIDSNMRVMKRGSSEHLDPMSPPPKEGADSLIAEEDLDNTEVMMR